MIVVHQTGPRMNRRFIVKNPKKIKFWRMMARDSTQAKMTLFETKIKEGRK